jgi:hypothetical protein
MDTSVRENTTTSSSCNVIGIPDWYYVVWFPALIFESILCLLMLYKVWRTYKEDWRSPLLDILLRDRCVTSRSRIYQY